MTKNQELKAKILAAMRELISAVSVRNRADGQDFADAERAVRGDMENLTRVLSGYPHEMVLSVADELEERALDLWNTSAMSPIPMLLWCPECKMRHVDKGEFATKPHHTHACQGCGHCWRPAIVPTVGVQFLPGFKDDEVIGGEG